MIAIEFKGHEKFQALFNALSSISEHLPNVEATVEALTGEAQRLWAQNSNVFEFPTGNYIRGIEEGREYPVGRDLLHGRVINRAGDYVTYLETGIGRFDMKKALMTSNKVRVVKHGEHKGQKYLVVPFRHGTAQRATMHGMPQAVHKIAKKLPTSRVVGTYQERGVYGGNVTRYRYKWGGQISQLAMRQAGMKAEGVRLYAGMVRFPRHPRAGGGQYMTFRIMGEWQSGWWHKGFKGKGLAHKTAQQVQTLANQLIPEAIQADLEILRGKI